MLVDKGSTDLADQFRLYDVFLAGAILAEVACTACLFIKRAHQHLPMLTFYLAFMSIADTLGAIIYMRGTTPQYWLIFVSAAGAEYCLQLAVMCELGFLLLKALPPHSVGRSVLLGVVGATACCGTAASLSAGLAMYRLVSSDVSGFFHLNLGFSIFRALVLLSLLCLATLLGRRANARVASLSAYFALYSVIMLLVDIAREYFGPVTNRFKTLECARLGTWCILMALIGWYVLARERHTDVGYGSNNEVGRWAPRKANVNHV